MKKKLQSAFALILALLLLLPLTACVNKPTPENESISADPNKDKSIFADPNFETAVRELIKKPKGDILPSDVSKITTLDISWKDIQDLSGIEHFTALEILNCNFNQLTKLDVSQNTALEILSCSANQLTELDVSQNTVLEILMCAANQLAALDVSGNTALTSLMCYSNELTELDVSQNPALETLACYHNRMPSESAVTGLDPAITTTFAFTPQR